VNFHERGSWRNLLRSLWGRLPPRPTTAQARASDLADTVKELQTAGCESLRAIAAELDARGIPAARGGKWSAVQVSRLLARVKPSTVQRISRPFDGASVAVA
jgi:hypothetical protein